MPFDTTFLQAMNSTVQWQAYIGEDDNGNPQYAAEVIPIQCAFEQSVSRGTQGQQVTVGPIDFSTYTIYIPPSGVQPRDLMTMPDGTRTYVNTVETFNDPQYGDPGLQVANTIEIR